MTAWLYRYEVKGIQSWILASERLAELRGGSAIVEDLAGLAAQRAGGDDRVLYAAAGGATLRFHDREEVDRFASTWPLVLSRVAPGLQVIHAWAPEDEPATLYERLGNARNRPIADLPEAGPWSARASRSGLPAVGRHDKVLEDAGSRRRRVGPKADEEGSVGPERIFDRPLSGRVPAVHFIRDIQNPAWRDAPLAVIHADGNGIGSLVMKKSPAEMRAFADAMTEASHRAARVAVEVTLHRFDGPPV